MKRCREAVLLLVKATADTNRVWENSFEVHFEVLAGLMSYQISLRDRRLWPILQHTSRGKSRQFGLTYGELSGHPSFLHSGRHTKVCYFLFLFIVLSYANHHMAKTLYSAYAHVKTINFPFKLWQAFYCISQNFNVKWLWTNTLKTAATATSNWLKTVKWNRKKSYWCFKQNLLSPHVS